MELASVEIVERSIIRGARLLECVGGCAIVGADYDDGTWLKRPGGPRSGRSVHC